MIDNGVKLERMASEIAIFFRSYPHDEAVAGVREHIQAFWAPVMRRELAAHIGAHADRIDPIVVEAFRMPSPGESPAHKEAAGPAVLGEIGASDAG